MSDTPVNKFHADRLEGRQIDELIGLARGLIADGILNQQEVEFLQKWLAANFAVSPHPLITKLYDRVTGILADGVTDKQELDELLDTLHKFTNRDFELGETLKSSSLPLCDPEPALLFVGKSYCLTGTFAFGLRRDCERAIQERGATVGGLTKKTSVLVVGAYATDSWKHSAFGNKILQACEWRAQGHPISIVSEQHWVKHL